MDDHEEFEHIPWSELNTGSPVPRNRTLVLAAGLIGAVVAGVLIGRMFLGTPAIVAADTSIPEAAAPIGEDPAAATPATSIDLPELPGLYSEADLMAVAPVGPERAAATRAEWFVYDYFTADMEPNGSADVVAALPAGAELPEMPQDSVSSLAYVEWARAFRVEEIGNNTYRVAVVFRMLGAPPDHGFYRLAARAVEVIVEVSPDGGAVVTELPMPINFPAAPEPPPWPTGGEDAPPSVVERATLMAGAWGDEPRLVVSQPIDGGWRVVLSVADEVGNRWPVAVRVEAAGESLQ